MFYLETVFAFYGKFYFGRFEILFGVFQLENLENR